jgi:hypothetical protein
VSFVHDVLHNVFLAPVNGDWGLGDVGHMLGRGCCCSLLKGLISEVWNTGKSVDCVGRLSVTVECFSSVAVILSGPSKQGMNLDTHGSSPDLYACHLWCHDFTMQL